MVKQRTVGGQGMRRETQRGERNTRVVHNSCAHQKKKTRLKEWEGWESLRTPVASLLRTHESGK
jgi:hypothetical protein